MLMARAKSTASDTGPRPHRRTSAEARFFRFVLEKPKRPSECWIWYGGTNSDVYPLIWGGAENPKQIYAARLAYEIYKGSIPNGYIVSQTCQNRKCVNPTHLICGPKGKLMARQMRLHRHTAKYGDDNKSSILTDAEVTHLRKLHSERRFSEIHKIAEEKGMSGTYVISVGRSKGRSRKPRRNRTAYQ